MKRVLLLAGLLGLAALTATALASPARSLRPPPLPGTPLPPCPSRRCRAVQHALNVGDSFVVPDAKIGCQVTRRGSSVLVECRRAGKAKGTYGTFISRKTVEGRAVQVQPDGAGRLHRQAGRQVACVRRAGEHGARGGGPGVPVNVPSPAMTARLSRPVLAASGRAVVVWLAVAVIASTVRPVDTGGLIAVTLVAVVWLLSLRAATASAPYALGSGVPAAIGAVTGLVCVAAANPIVPDLRMPHGTLLVMALGVFLSSAVWDSALERTARRRVLVVGNSAVTNIIAAARRGHRVPFEVFGTLTDAPEGVIAQPRRRRPGRPRRRGRGPAARLHRAHGPRVVRGGRGPAARHDRSPLPGRVADELL